MYICIKMTMNKEDLSFLYTITHELKTPIITLEGFLNAIKEDFADNLPEEAQEYIHHMDIAVKRLKFIITDLLNLSMFCQKNDKKKRFPIKEIIDEVLIRMKPLIQQKGIEIKMDNGLPFVYGNKRQIELVMENLISNAIKYIGKDNPHPIIKIGIRNINGKNLIFIEDNGIGIEEKYQDKIFDIFQRTPSAKKEAEGTGIGLFIVKNIVEANEGEIWVESCPGDGSTFYLYIPEGMENGSHKNNNNR